MDTRRRKMDKTLYDGKRDIIGGKRENEDKRGKNENKQNSLKRRHKMEKKDNR